MKVILTQDHNELGVNGTMVDVKEGYARNFLIPRNLAVHATKNVMAHYESRKKARANKEAAILQKAKDLAAKLEDQLVKAVAKVGEEGRLYGTITSKEIADILFKNHEINVDRKQIEIPNPIKLIGDYKVNIKVHPSVIASVKVNVQAEDA